MQKIIVLNPFTLDPVQQSEIGAILCADESLTDQSQVDQSDINTIVRQFGVTGELPYGKPVPFYEDITSFPTDYQEAENFLIASREAFMELPSDQRERFDNHPGKFLNFISNENNYDEAIKLGMIIPPSPPADGLPDPKPASQPKDAPPGGSD